MNKPQLNINDSNIAIITLGPDDEKVTILTEERINELKELVIQAKSADVAGIIFSGISEFMFSAGADINLISSVQDKQQGYELAKKGQEFFQEIEDLKITTVAAISGPCVGGACELALSCDFRLITNSKPSSIGLPEIKIGILPGFGGTQRLPRLIGLPESLKIILAGKVLKPKQALRVGLVDAVLPYNDLIDRAVEIISSKKTPQSKISLKDKIAGFFLLRNLAFKEARKSIIKKTKGFYPAPLLAIDVIKHGLDHGLTAGYQKEAEALGELIVTPECKALTNLFFLTEKSKGKGKSAKDFAKDLKVVVMGAGVMGAGIAGEFARVGYQVILKDISQENIDKGLKQIRKNLSKIRYLDDEQRSNILSNITGLTEFTDQLDADLVIEAIFENLELKQKVLAEATMYAKTDAVIATNTSSLSVNDISENFLKKENAAGMHFFNPVPKMPLVEIVRGSESSDQTINKVASIVKKLGKFPIIVEDVHGFLINRVLTPFLNEASYLLEEGYNIQEVDRAVTDFGMPMGPYRLLDEIGLDIAMHVNNSMSAAYGKRLTAPNIAEKMLENKFLGKKSKLGFYNYSSYPETVNNEIYKLFGKPEKSINEELKLQIQQRMVMSMFSEAILCLDEGVAGEPGSDAAKQIDLGTIMGLGFPAFRGGIIYYGEALGAKQVVNILQKLERNFGQRFRPNRGIFQRAEKGLSFYEKL